MFVLLVLGTNRKRKKRINKPGAPVDGTRQRTRLAGEVKTKVKRMEVQKNAFADAPNRVGGHLASQNILKRVIN